MDILINILIIVAVILIFNFVIFIHELGHFLAAKWRGLHVDRFQIWFGKPIWKKTIGGVQYGIGYIPAGGFVSLPQMVDMEGIEGKVEGEAKRLPPAKPLDKIIVAFAGPLFSFLLAMAAALIVWGVGVPANKRDTTTVGYAIKDMPSFGLLKPGDKILEVEGEPVGYWIGSPPQDSVIFNVIVSGGDTVDFKVERDGKEMTVSTGFEIPDRHFMQRAGKRVVGIYSESEAIVAAMFPHGPAEKAGLQILDVITHVDGEQIWSPQQLESILREKEKASLTVRRADQVMEVPIELSKPIGLDYYHLGVRGWSGNDKFVEFSNNIVKPNPWEQTRNHVELMYITIAKIASSDNNIKVSDLSSPVGIAMTYFDMLKVENGWRLMLSFTVLLNVNLAILNLLPLPVLDGGHITMSIYEILMKRPVPVRILAVVQGGFVFLLMGFMLFIATKDVSDRVIGSEGEVKKIEFAPPENAEPSTSNGSTE